MKHKLALITFLFLLNAVVYGQEKPNIIIIMADDMGWGDVGYHGSDIKTPHLDKLSQEGVRLNRFYVAPVCSPTRAGLLTGRYPDRFGLRETVIPPWRDFGLDPTEEFLPELLAKAGYKNRAVIGKWHLGHSSQEYYPLKNGFTHFYGHLNGAIDYFTHTREGELDWHNDYKSSYDKGYATDLLSEDAVRSIKTYSREQQPFFIYLAYNAPHTPLQAARQDLDQYGYDPAKPGVFDNPMGSEGRGTTEWQTYAAMVTGMDRGIGEVLKTLDELDIKDNTIVLFFSDNGPDVGGGGGSSGQLRGHKFHEWEGGVRVPAIIRWPDQIVGGRVIDQVTGYVDIMPTLSEIASPGYKTKRAWDGINILPVLTNKIDQIDRYFYLGSGAILSQDWKYIQANRNSRMPLEEDMLFNISADPYERTNLIDREGDELKKLQSALVQYDTIMPSQEVLPYHVGRKDFKAPKEWDLFRD